VGPVAGGTRMGLRAGTEAQCEGMIQGSMTPAGAITIRRMPFARNRTVTKTPKATLSPEQFAEQFSASFRMLWSVAAGFVRDRALAEDIVQEAAVVGLRRLGQFEPGTSFSAWMGRIVRNVALNQARKRRRRREAPMEASGVSAAESTSATAAAHEGDVVVQHHGRLPEDQQHFDDRLMSALADVSDTARACLLMRTLGEMSYAEISGVLEIPEGTAMSHVHRARGYLRKRLAEHGVHSAADLHG
jgi:RNA polymerase sigma-70 factor (ECF subfamily)